MNKIVVITGASSGIGLSTAKYFIKNFDTVINLSLEPCEETPIFFECDVSNEENVKTVFQKIKDKYKKVDILINCAGYGASGATELIPIEKAKKLFDVNVFGSMCCINNALPLMSEGAKIINIASSMALFPLPYRAYYSASKAAVLNLSYGQRLELKPAGIYVSVVCPGNVKTNFTKNKLKEYQTNERYENRIKNATSKLDSGEDKRLSPKVVGKAIFKLANKKKPKTMIIVGGKDHIYNFAKHLFPISWVLWGCNKFGNKKKQN